MESTPKFVFFGRGDVAEAALKSMNARGLVPSGKGDLGVVASYGKIIPKKIIESFKYGILNIHPSLLPTLRGPSPIKSAILEGLEKTGVTIMLLDEEMDHGPILVQEEIDLSPQVATANELRDQLMESGVELLARVIPEWIAGKIKPWAQDHSKATFTKKFTTQNTFIKPETITGESTPEEVAYAERQVRALNPEPGTWTELKASRPQRSPGDRDAILPKRIKILSAQIKDDKLVPLRVVPAGKKEMSWSDFQRGNPIAQ